RWTAWAADQGPAHRRVVGERVLSQPDAPRVGTDPDDVVVALGDGDRGRGAEVSGVERVRVRAGAGATEVRADQVPILAVVLGFVDLVAAVVDDAGIGRIERDRSDILIARLRRAVLAVLVETEWRGVELVAGVAAVSGHL